MELEPNADITTDRGTPPHQAAARRDVKRPTRSHRLRVPVTPAEKARIEDTAGAVNLPAAVYLRHLGLGLTPRAVLEHEHIQELFRVAGDVGRFGGLLKLWLTEDPQTDRFDRAQIQRAVLATDDTKGALRAAVRRALKSDPQGAAVGEAWSGEQTPPKRVTQLQVHVTPDERTRIRESARCLGLSVAAYLRNPGLRYRPTSIIDPDRLQELLETRRELTRLGTLLKRWLVNDPKLARLPPSHVHQAIQRSLDRSFEYLDALQKLARHLVLEA